MEEEIWLSVLVPGYSDMYEVSNMGRVRNILGHRCANKDGTRRFIKNKKGYLRVKLKRNGVCKLVLVHRLVAMAFIPNPENKTGINHRFGNKEDNRVDSIEWSTTAENNSHAAATGLNKSLRMEILNPSTGEKYYSKSKYRKETGASFTKIATDVNKG